MSLYDICYRLLEMASISNGFIDDNGNVNVVMAWSSREISFIFLLFSGV